MLKIQTCRCYIPSQISFLYTENLKHILSSMTHVYRNHAEQLRNSHPIRLRNTTRSSAEIHVITIDHLRPSCVLHKGAVLATLIRASSDGTSSALEPLRIPARKAPCRLPVASKGFGLQDGATDVSGLLRKNVWPYSHLFGALFGRRVAILGLQLRHEAVMLVLSLRTCSHRETSECRV